MNYLALSGVVIAISSILCSAMVFMSKPSSTLKSTWGFFSLTVGLWGFGLYRAYTAVAYNDALFWLRFLNLFAITIPVFFIHFIFLFIGGFKKRMKEVFFYYFFSIVCIAIALQRPELFIPRISSRAGFSFYPDPGWLYYLFSGLFLFLATYGLFVLARHIKKFSHLMAVQAKYILVGTSVGFMGGGTTFFYVFNIPVYPFGVILVVLYVFSISYAIIRYRFMDIRLVVTSASIFITVYTLVLGIPVWAGFKMMGSGPWLFPVALMAFLATGGPFFYLWVQRRAEERLLAEQRKYQFTLRQASAGMGRIRDLKRLLNLIVSILTRVVRIEHAFIYFFDKVDVYRLSASRRISGKDLIQSELRKDCAIVKYFKGSDLPLIREEIRQRIERDKEDGLKVMGDDLDGLKAELVFPIFIRLQLVAIVVMGKKANRRGYSEDDLAVFSILSNQASLAIENAQSYEEMQKTQEQLFKAEKMATIGTMADGLSHQINNRLHALGFIASDMMDTLKVRKPLFMTPELKSVADELEYSLSRVQDNIARGGEIVQGLMKYTRKGEEGFASCSIDDIIRTSYEMAQFKIRSADFKILKDYDPQSIPQVRGNFTQLQEVFFNLIDNAYDATVQRKTELKEEAYVGTVRVDVKEVDGLVEIVFSDNGIGVKPVDMDKLFTPFFTTKATSKKGTGLGLYVIRKIIEDNHGGKVEMNSVYGQGTDMVLHLSLSRE